MSYRIIVADPPWHYNNRRATRLDNPSRAVKFGVGAAGKYAAGVMSMADLNAMGDLVRAVAAPDAYLLLWATCPRLPEACWELVQNWGFDFTTVAFVWEKLYPNGSSFCGPGRYTFSNIEPVLLGTRGKCWHPATGPKPRQVIRTPHARDEAGKIIHSRKPEEMQDRLEAWLGPHLEGHGMLELFATRQRPGWTCLGHSVTGRDIREDLAAIAGRAA